MRAASDPCARTRGSVSERQRGLAVWIATAGGVGYFPVAPGTWGSLVGVGAVAALGLAGLQSSARSAAAGAAIVLIFALGVWSAGQAEDFFGRKDPGTVVVDEVAGQIIALAPFIGTSLKWLGAGFVLFRIFDVLKPFPARRAERLHAGWGIMMDDVTAGVYAAATLEIIRTLVK